MNDATTNSLTWPTTVGAVCIVVGGLSLFGGCLSLTGMTELEQLYTAIPFGGGDFSEELVVQLAEHAPPIWFSTAASIVNILFSLVLTVSGMAILQRAHNARMALLCWSGLYLLFTITHTVVSWIPRWELVKTVHEVKGLFIAQLVISSPMYLVLPVFLLIFLNRQHVRNEISNWR